MIPKEKGKMLANYLRGLKDFELVQGSDYDHMGAIIVDAMLQAGANYDGVKERVNRVLNYPDARTTSGFLKLLARVPVHSLLQWEGKKPKWVLDVAGFLKAERIESKSDLREWLEVPSNVQRLYAVSGVGNKTVDYLKKLAGIPNTAMDRHWYACLESAGIPYESYTEAKQIADYAAEQMGVDKSLLDTSVWRYFRKKNRGYSCS
jgi:hypothetical protein